MSENCSFDIQFYLSQKEPFYRKLLKLLVETRGIEPLTSAMPFR